jgi:hypothetical protein
VPLIREDLSWVTDKKRGEKLHIPIKFFKKIWRKNISAQFLTNY